MQLFLKYCNLITSISVMLIFCYYSSLSLDLGFRFLYFEKFENKNAIYPSPDFVRGIPWHMLIERMTISWKGKVKKDDFREEMSSLINYVDNNSVGDPEHFSHDIVVIRNAYVSQCFTISDGNTMYAFWYKSGLDWNYVCGWDMPVSYYVDEVIAFGHSSVGILGHWFFDFLTSLMMLPEDILNRAKVLVRSENGFSGDTLKLLGIRNDQILKVSNGSWIYANVVYSMNPAPHIHNFGLPMRKLADKLKAALKLDNSTQPDGYYIMNRYSRQRMLKDDDIKELLKYLRKGSLIEWKIYNDDANTIKEYANVWNDVKFAFAPTGSNLVGIMFIHKNSVLVIAQCNLRDTAFINLALTFEAKVVSFSNANSVHFDEKNYIELDMNLAKRCAKLGLYAVNHGKWPPKS